MFPGELVVRAVSVVLRSYDKPPSSGKPSFNGNRVDQKSGNQLSMQCFTN